MLVKLTVNRVDRVNRNGDHHISGLDSLCDLVGTSNILTIILGHPRFIDLVYELNDKIGFLEVK